MIIGKEDYRAKGEKSEGEKIEEKKKSKNKRSTNGMQMPTMWTRRYYYY